MTSITVQDGKILLRDGAIGTEQACCCEQCCSCECEGLECSFERAFDALGNEYLLGCDTAIVNGPCNFDPPGSGPIPYSKYISFSEPFDPDDPFAFVPGTWAWAAGYPEALDADCRYLWVCSSVFTEAPCSGGDAECPKRCSYSASECRLWKVTDCVTGAAEDITSIASETGEGAASSGAFATGPPDTPGVCACNDPPGQAAPACEPDAAICNEFP